MLISPTEPKIIRELGETSSTPETYGADILWASRNGLIGVQRKEYKDFIQSVYDGRLDKELSQLKQVDVPILIIEGVLRFSSDGKILGVRSEWSKAQQIGAELSIQSKNVSILRSDHIQGTIELLSLLKSYMGKARSGIASRSGPKSKWGRKDNKDWLYHLVQGIEGVGPELAQRIVDRFGCPFMWNPEIDIVELMTLEGIGLERARKIYGALG